MYEGQTVSDNNITWKVKNVSNKPHSLPYVGGGIYNTITKITTSGTFTAPCDAWYRFVLKGAGSGGQSGKYAYYVDDYVYTLGASGGEGGTSFAYEYMFEGGTASLTIGAGSNGGAINGSINNSENAGNTILVVNGNTYIAGGASLAWSAGALGGSGDIRGACGQSSRNAPKAYKPTTTNPVWAAAGAGSGGSIYGGTTAVDGGGGYGGNLYGPDAPNNAYGQIAPGKGGDGYIFIEYFDPNK